MPLFFFGLFLSHFHRVIFVLNPNSLIRHISLREALATFSFTVLSISSASYTFDTPFRLIISNGSFNESIHPVPATAINVLPDRADAISAFNAPSVTNTARSSQGLPTKCAGLFEEVPFSSSTLESQIYFVSLPLSSTNGLSSLI